MNRTKFILLTLLLLPGWQTFGQNVQHLSVAVPGGMPGTPLVTGTNLLTNGVNVTWDGQAGFYQLFESSNTNNPRWVALTQKTTCSARPRFPPVIAMRFSR